MVPGSVKRRVVTTHRANKRWWRNGQLRGSQMVALNVSHRRRLASRNMPKVIEMLMNAKIAKPSRINRRRDLEQMLIQSARSASPQHALKRTGPREQDVAVFDDVFWV